MSTLRLPQREHTSRFHQSSTGVAAPYRAAISAGSVRPDADKPCTRQSTGRGPRRRCRASPVAPVLISPAASLSLTRSASWLALFGCRRSRQWRRGRCSGQLRADSAQHSDARRQRKPVVFDDRVESCEKCRGFLVAQVELHAKAPGCLAVIEVGCAGVSASCQPQGMLTIPTSEPMFGGAAAP
jgi:hypothetical protein